MDIFRLVGTFWQEHERAHFSHSAVALYFRLLHEANRRFWCGPLLLSWRYLQDVLGMSSATLGRAISDLKSRGMITYERKGKRASFWFPDCFNNESKNHFNYESNQDHCFNYESPDESKSESKHESNGESIYKKQEDYKTVRQEDRKKIKNTNCKSPNGDLRTAVREPLPEIVPSWYTVLNEYKKEIIDLWQTLIGPWQEDWLEDLDTALQVCYPAQVKQAIQAMALTRPHILQSNGFPYLVTPLLKGAFGRKRPRKAQKQEKWSNRALKGVKEWLKGGSTDEFW